MLKNLQADYFYTSIYNIPVSFYKEHGITHLFVDLDNTLTGDEDRNQPSHFIPWLTQMEAADLVVVIVSNNKVAERVESFLGKIEILWHHDAHKQDGKLFTELLDKLAITASEVAVIGDRILTDIVGGNKIGALTILTAPISDDKHPLIKYVRAFEKLIKPKHQ